MGKKIEFSYFLSEKPPILVVTIAGILNIQTSASIVPCVTEILGRQSQTVILNLRGLADLDQPGVASLIRLQWKIRQSQKDLRLCFLRPDILKLLVEHGAVRHAEIFPTLLAALKPVENPPRSKKSKI